jgi:putative addiction module component (TIGR02574 family)
MSTTEIREQLHRYIDHATDKKVKAIYTMVEEEIQPDSVWADDEFVAELERRVNEVETGEVKPYSWQEVQARAAKALKAANIN